MKKESQPINHKDPVCGMEISRESAVSEVEYEGVRYYFCSDTCKTRFLREPQRYVSAGETA